MGGGHKSPIFLKETMKVNWNYQKGGVGVQNQKKIPMGGDCIFSVPTHLTIMTLILNAENV